MVSSPGSVRRPGPGNRATLFALSYQVPKIAENITTIPKLPWWCEECGLLFHNLLQGNNLFVFRKRVISVHQPSISPEMS
jgi:hypothetical protein